VWKARTEIYLFPQVTLALIYMQLVTRHYLLKSGEECRSYRPYKSENLFRPEVRYCRQCAHSRETQNCWTISRQDYLYRISPKSV